MPTSPSIRAMLTVGRHKLDLGRGAEVLALLRAHPRRANQLIECLWDEDHGVAGRASDVMEKLFDERRELFESWKEPLLGLLAEAEPIKVRWRLAALVPRLSLSFAQSRRASEILQALLDDSSSIVKTCALDGLASIATREPSFTPTVLDLLRVHSRSGTPAMRARGRKLLKLFRAGGAMQMV